MSIYKKAARERLRVSTNKGDLNVEQLMTLNVSEIANIGNSLATQLESTGKNKPFSATTKTKEDELVQLRFDIVKDIYDTKLSESNESTTRAALNEEEQLLLQIEAEEQLKEMRNNPALRKQRLAEIEAKKAALK